MFAGYLCSCVALLLATSFVIAVPALSGSLLHHDNVLVKDAATQSGEFVTCIFGLLYFLIEAVDRRRWDRAVGSGVIILAMLASILYASTGRTALVVIVVLLVVLAIKRPNAKVIGSIYAPPQFSSAFLPGPLRHIFMAAPPSDLKQFETADTVTSSGERLVF